MFSNVEVLVEQDELDSCRTQQMVVSYEMYTYVYCMLHSNRDLVVKHGKMKIHPCLKL
jgi:hypothetical protein